MAFEAGFWEDDDPRRDTEVAMERSIAGLSDGQASAAIDAFARRLGTQLPVLKVKPGQPIEVHLFDHDAVAFQRPDFVLFACAWDQLPAFGSLVWAAAIPSRLVTHIPFVGAVATDQVEPDWAEISALAYRAATTSLLQSGFDPQDVPGKAWPRSRRGPPPK